MNGRYWHDEFGDPYLVEDLMTWARLMESDEPTRQIKQDFFAMGPRVSTIFLGLDHNFGGTHSMPILWETMVFGGEYHGYQARYTNRVAALEGHERTCAMIAASYAWWPVRLWRKLRAALT
jgi:hypothetical protein